MSGKSDVGVEPKRRKRVRSKNKNSNVVAFSTFSKQNESANGSLSSLEEENNSVLPNASENKASFKVSHSLQKLQNRHDELAVAILKSRQAFSAHKLSTFFCLDASFIKDLGESLQKTEQSIQTMGQILAKAMGRPYSDLTIETSPNSRSSAIAEPVAHSVPSSLDKAVHPLGSLTPPSSEVGNDDDNVSGIDDSTQSLKRKSNTSSESVLDVGKRNRKLRKCTVTNPVSSKKIVDKTEEQPVEVKEESEEETVSKTNAEVEYEVRQIQDYVRKQGSSYYRVSWRGYDSDDDTFEPADHLTGCDEALTNFFIKRLNERRKATMPEDLKSLLLPADERVKELMYAAFEKTLLPLSESSKDRAWKLITAPKKPALKSKEELADEILKFVAVRDPSTDRNKKLFTSISDQILLKEVGHQREKQLAQLRAWERSINMVSSDPALLTVENTVDLDLPPMDFIYINGYLAGKNINIPNDPVAGCECQDCNSNQKYCCAHQMGSYFAYNKYGRLRISLGTPIYECNKLCKCPPDCPNRIVQKGRGIPLSIFRTSNGRGWGVKTLEAIKKDTFVTEYVGEVISSEEAEERGRKYDAQGCTYLFDLDYNRGDLNPYTVDAARYGNVSHYINHCCDPNLVVFNVWINCLDPDLPKLALFATRDIRKGEEITFDYNSGSTRQMSGPRLELNEDGMDFAHTTPSKSPHTPSKLIASPSKLFSSPIKSFTSPNKSFESPNKSHTTPNKSLTTPTKNGDMSPLMLCSDVILKTPKNRGPNAGKTLCRCGAANCRKYFF